MTTDPRTIVHLLDQLAPAGEVTARKMFGEYALYLEGRVVALVCNDLLFLKPTPGALALLEGSEMRPPYPGAAPHILIDAALDDEDLMRDALRAVLADLPSPQPRKR